MAFDTYNAWGIIALFSAACSARVHSWGGGGEFLIAFEECQLILC